MTLPRESLRKSGNSMSLTNGGSVTKLVVNPSQQPRIGKRFRRDLRPAQHIS